MSELYEIGPLHKNIVTMLLTQVGTKTNTVMNEMMIRTFYMMMM